MGAAASLANPTCPLGHKGQRGAVLIQLKRSQPLTAKELASRLGVSLNAARHHLKELEVEGLVRYDRAHRGVGAPAFCLPAERGGRGAVSAALPGDPDVAARSDRRARGAGSGGGAARVLLSPARRPDQRSWKGSPPDGAAGGGRPGAHRAGIHGGAACGRSAAVLTEHNCAIPAVADRFPEICAAEARFLADVLGAEVERRGHILNGCAACEYQVRFNGS